MNRPVTADRVTAAHHDDVIVLQVLDGVLEHLPFADHLVEFGVGHRRSRAPLLGYLPGRGGHLLEPISAGRREACGQNGDVDTALGRVDGRLLEGLAAALSVSQQLCLSRSSFKSSDSAAGKKSPVFRECDMLVGKC